MPKTNRQPKQPSGLTLMEMVVSMAIMAVVFSVFAPMFYNINNSWASRRNNMEMTQTARVLLDHIHYQIKRSTKVEAISSPGSNSGYLNLTKNDGSTVRYQLTNGILYFGDPGDVEPMGGPISRFNVKGYSLEDYESGPTTDVTQIRFVKVTIGIPSNETGGTREYSTAGNLMANGNEPPYKLKKGPQIVVKDNIDIRHWTLVDGYDSSKGNYGNGNNSSIGTLSSNTTQMNNIEIKDYAQVYGDIFVGEGGDPDVVIQIWPPGDRLKGDTGVLEEDIDIPSIQLPSDTGGSLGKLELDHNDFVKLKSSCRFSELKIEDNARLRIDEDINVWVDGNVRIRDNARFLVKNNRTCRLFVGGRFETNHYAQVNMNNSPSALKIYMYGWGDLDTEDYSHLCASAVVPNADLELEDWSHFYGGFIGQDLEVFDYSQCHIDIQESFGPGVPSDEAIIVP